MRILITLFLVIHIGAQSFAQTGDDLFDESYVHELRLTWSDPHLWDSLVSLSWGMDDADAVYLPVDIEIDGIQLNQVGLKIKGFTSSSEPVKKPFRIDFNKFVQGQHYDGMKKLSLNNSFMDPSYMRDVLAFNIMREAGVKASRTAYAKLYINDAYWGVYIMVEQVDKTFLKNNFENDKGNLYKCMWNSDLSYLGDSPEPYKELFDLKTNEAEDDWSGFIDFVKHINKIGISEREFEEAFPQLFNIPDYLKVLAVDVLIFNWDSYYDHGRNFHIYEDKEANKFHWIPWDYNFSFAPYYTDILMKDKEKPLIRNLLKEPGILDLYLQTYRKLLADNFTSERLADVIDRNKELIYADLQADPNRSMDMELFERCLDKDSSQLVRDTLVQVFDMDWVYIIEPGVQIPDSIFENQIPIADTSWVNIVAFDTVQVGDEEKVYMTCTSFFEYTITYTGLKSFIAQRINTVNSELDDLGIVAAEEEVFMDDDNLALFPNPATTEINVSSKKIKGPAYVTIFDLQGRIVYKGNHKPQINVSGLSTGTYFLKVTDHSQTVGCTFMKQ